MSKSTAEQLASLRELAAAVSEDVGVPIAVNEDLSLNGDGWAVTAFPDHNYARRFIFGMGLGARLAKQASA